MSLFEFLGNLFSLNNEPTTTGTDINPANGLPMMDKVAHPLEKVKLASQKYFG